MPRRSRPPADQSRAASARRGRRGLAVLGAIAVCGPLAATAGAATAQNAFSAVDDPSSTSATANQDSGDATITTGTTRSTATGYGGAVSTVDADATAVALKVLREGGNAADAAIAAAAALGVTEPYSAGIGGGGFLMYYDAKKQKVSSIDGRETAPKTFTSSSFQNADGTALDFDTVVNSGLSVGVPGTPALWEKAADKFGTWNLDQLLAPAQDLAENGFVVDQTFHDQTEDNAERFAKFPATAAVYLPDGQVPAVGSTFTNPDLAKAYQLLRTEGAQALYQGELGQAVLDAVADPQTSDGSQVYGSELTSNDLASYVARMRAPITSTYEDLTVYGMSTPSSGGIAVAEALNLLEAYPGKSLNKLSDVQYLHRLAEASATAFADRNRYVGDFGGTPIDELISQGYADERACQLFDADSAAARPIPFGRPDGIYGDCTMPSVSQDSAADDHGTTHVTVADQWGNVASYTLTIEQTGGSAITVPGYGFLLNNELTDFDFVPLTAGVPDPNMPGSGKRPRSSMAPTIVLKKGEPYLALGSPGGATIITTVLQVLTEKVDRGLSLSEAIDAPRLSSRNGSTDNAEPAIIDGALGSALTAMGHSLTESSQIGAATAIEFLADDRLLAAAESTRRGGGTAGVVSTEPTGKSTKDKKTSNAEATKSGATGKQSARK